MLNRLVVLALIGAAASVPLGAENWPNWRGPALNGTSPETGLPTSWNATQNVAWKMALPAYSGSSPVVWNDLVFLNVATARSTGGMELWAIDRKTQSVAWKRAIAGGNRTGRKQNMTFSQSQIACCFSQRLSISGSLCFGQPVGTRTLFSITAPARSSAR